MVIFFVDQTNAIDSQTDATEATTESAPTTEESVAPTEPTESSVETESAEVEGCMSLNDFLLWIYVEYINIDINIYMYEPGVSNLYMKAYRLWNTIWLKVFKKM